MELYTVWPTSFSRLRVMLGALEKLSFPGETGLRPASYQPCYDLSVRLHLPGFLRVMM